MSHHMILTLKNILVFLTLRFDYVGLWQPLGSHLT
jgi:hypothetical protein